MDVFYKHDVDIFSTDLEVCSQHLNVVYVKTIQTPTSQILKYKPTFLGTWKLCSVENFAY